MCTHTFLCFCRSYRAIMRVYVSSTSMYMIIVHGNANVFLIKFSYSAPFVHSTAILRKCLSQLNNHVRAKWTQNYESSNDR